MNGYLQDWHNRGVEGYPAPAQPGPNAEAASVVAIEELVLASITRVGSVPVADQVERLTL